MTGLKLRHHFLFAFNLLLQSFLKTECYNLSEYQITTAFRVIPLQMNRPNCQQTFSFNHPSSHLLTHPSIQPLSHPTTQPLSSTHHSSMAGIVASTLRRKAFHKRTQDTRYQAIDTDPINILSRSSSSSSSLDSLSHLGYRSAVCKPPRGAQLSYQDFWPRCLNSCYANDPLMGVCEKKQNAAGAFNKQDQKNKQHPQQPQQQQPQQQQPQQQQPQQQPLPQYISNNSNSFNYKAFEKKPSQPLLQPKLGASKKADKKVKKDTKKSAIAQLVVRNNALLAMQQQRQQLDDNISLAQFESFESVGFVGEIC